MCAMSAATSTTTDQRRTAPVHRDRPRRHRRARPRRGDRVLPRRLRHAGASTRRSTRSRACARRCSAVGDSGSCIQLLAPLSPESTIAKFLDRSGPGIQQLAYRVDDVEHVAAVLRERGLRLLYDAPKRGTSDSRINFIHPKDAGGVLVELVEPGRRTETPAHVSHTAHHDRLLAGILTPIVPPMPHQEAPVQNILEAILSGDATAEDFASLALPESYRAVFVQKDEVDMFEGLAAKEKDPRKSLHVDEVAAARARPRRGLRRRDGQRHQLQHRVDLDLRAGLDLRVPRALRPHLRAHQAARPALPRGRLRPVRRRAQDRPRRHQVEAGRPRSSRTASPSSSRAPTATTTRCSTPSSGSGASRPTSAAWPTWRWSRPTS